MKWALLQMDIVKGDCVANISTARRLMDAHAEADVYVLPEMWATGFVTEPTEQTFLSGVRALAWMKQKATERQCVITGSLAVKENGECRNRFYWVAPNEVVQYYDKRHLFSPGGEGKTYTSGNRRVVVEWGDVRILLLTCYDLRFPVFARNRGDYDVMLCVASWPASRARVWDLLLHARAVENQCFAIGVNRVGTDEHGTYSGGSVAVDAYGRNLIEPISDEGVLAFSLDMSNLQAFRSKFPVLSDADAFTAEW